MARWLVAGAGAVAASEGLVAVLSMVIVLIVCVSMLLALCATHGSQQVLHRESEGESPEVKKHSQRFISNHLQMKLNSFRKSSFRKVDCKQQVDVVDGFEPGMVPEDEENGAVWQRTILRGERCEPLEFSGLILYDEKGNPIPGNALPIRTTNPVYNKNNCK